EGMPMGGPGYGGAPMGVQGFGGMPMGGPGYGGAPMGVQGFSGGPMGQGYPMTSPQGQRLYDDDLADTYQGAPYAPKPQAIDDCGCGGPRLMPNGYPAPFYPQADVAPFGWQGSPYDPNLYGPESIRDDNDQ
ncbi:MAG TPA: hypothetical protein VNM69_02580, partial [Bacillus sp. (in: firmicutes)]|nr:hypothetical protein [Bacillus sp. (in: firmicutes)]